mmetsp:Transcript_29471/g.42153  ORF Transcript_29471/g.42153 Transcript_29471/m.42153 type:complete len:246 (+) Transcript_29471:82-819(+)
MLLSSFQRRLTTFSALPLRLAEGLLTSSSGKSQKPFNFLLDGISYRHLATKGRPRKDHRSEKAAPALQTNSSQHEEWVKFQQSISVSGFQTGQKTETSKLGGKNVGRGGITLRKKKEKLRLGREQSTREDMGGGHFPALRYSDEETERLLAQAYAAIPPRAGKRGTRNLKRQRIRMSKKREQHAIYKNQLIKTHERRMVHRSKIATECRAVREGAEEVRQRDLNYQKYVLQRWVSEERMVLGKEE